jgi:hypothetical protein
MVGFALMIAMIVMGIHIGIAMALVGFLGMAAITGVEAAWGLIRTSPY